MKLAEIEHLNRRLFKTRWKRFQESDFSDPALRFPGVYLLSFTSKDIEDCPVTETDILYVGMSNAKGGVRTRLKQFRDGIEKYGTHSGAMRFYREYQRNKPFSKMKWRKRFFYTAISIECESEKSKLTAEDLCKLGHVCCLEYYAIARIKRRTGHTPPLNKFGKRPVPE